MTTQFHESSTDPRVAQVPLAHLSVELGHVYMEDFEGGPEALHRRLGGLGPWLAAAEESLRGRLGGRRTRMSTCFLVDDYFARTVPPAKALPALVEVARENGLPLDYVARESGCAFADGVPIARLVEAGLVPVPLPGDNGARPPATDSGWLSNGRRSPAAYRGEAMAEPLSWAAPWEVGARRHSIFADVQLWDAKAGTRTWSCPFLASVWQLMRLGMLRYQGRDIVRPWTWEGPFPDDWDELPPVIRLNPDAQPFCAYRTLSVLEPRFLPVEHAVRVITGQFAPDPEVLRQTAARYAAEAPGELEDVVDRIAYVFPPA
ncbi:SCO2522 family protein [Yinghuangia aomiensis]|uniref:SCO2522 family protein n=1 Tax=Yinghuangia aomiensis TaxID=676205 RepID=A0ABP9H6L8_9ACTN